jgi:hypothetical protein
MTTIIDAMSDTRCFGPWFEGASWAAWRVLLKAAFALPMTPQQIGAFGELAGGRSPPTKRASFGSPPAVEPGRTASPVPLATYAATIEQAYVGRLRPGETATVNRDQSRIVTNEARAFFDAVPDLGAMVTRETRCWLDLDSSVELPRATIIRMRSVHRPCWRRNGAHRG